MCNNFKQEVIVIDSEYMTLNATSYKRKNEKLLGKQLCMLHRFIIYFYIIEFLLCYFY